jgi:hypothetical protein
MGRNRLVVNPAELSDLYVRQLRKLPQGDLDAAAFVEIAAAIPVDGIRLEGELEGINPATRTYIGVDPDHGDLPGRHDSMPAVPRPTG